MNIINFAQKIKIYGNFDYIFDHWLYSEFSSRKSVTKICLYLLCVYL